MRFATRPSQQLWKVPPLSPVKYALAPSGITATSGNESVQISVCRPGVIHFVATPDPPQNVKSQRPWVLDPSDSPPGAKFQVSQNADAAVLLTDSPRVELSLKWGNVQYSTCQ